MSTLTKTLGTFVRGVVESHTHDDVVDVFKVARALGFLVAKDDLKIADKGKLFPSGVEIDREKTTLPTILLNKNNTEAEDRTVTVLLIAEYMLMQRSDVGRVLSCDTFFLSDIRQFRVSRHLFLATRLAIPENIIEKTQDIQFSAPKYSLKAKLLPAFLACAYPKRDVSGLLGFIDSMQMNFTIGKRIGNSQAKVDDFLPAAKKEEPVEITLDPGNNNEAFRFSSTGTV